MAEQENTETIGAKISIVEDWIHTISHERRVEEIDIVVLGDVLKEFGANFEDSEKLRPLSKYSNKAKRSGLDAVWGSDRVDAYKEWVKQWLEKYEAETGKPLPALKKSGIKISGMMHVLGELTALAAGEMPFADYKKYTEARALNGWLWQQGRKKDRVPVKVPTKDEPILLSSFPPSFPKAAWEKIKSWQ